MPKSNERKQSTSGRHRVGRCLNNCPQAGAPPSCNAGHRAFLDGESLQSAQQP